MGNRSFAIDCSTSNMHFQSIHNAILEYFIVTCTSNRFTMRYSSIRSLIAVISLNNRIMTGSFGCFSLVMIGVLRLALNALSATCVIRHCHALTPRTPRYHPKLED
eukprot:474946_1